MNVKIEQVVENPSLLEQVIGLGDKNNGTLGFFPRGAFIQAAKNKRILAAIAPDERLAGYLLYRIIPSKNNVSITHLCVDEKCRGKGIARKLVDHLKQITTSFRGIGLFSRRDYKSNTFWPHMGFVYKSEKVGRGKEQVPLTYYWYDHSHPSLLRLVNEQAISSKGILAAMDANIFYELQGNHDHPLLVNWLLEDVAMCITPELFNEINRNKNAQQRKVSLRYAHNFPEISVTQNHAEQIFDLLKNQFTSDRIQDKSDLKQLAYAIAAEADFFITRDVRLADQIRQEVYTSFGVSIIRPEDLIIHVDELMNAAAYQPSRLAGTQFEVKRVGAGQSNDLASAFQDQASEKKTQLADKLRHFLGQPERFEVDVVHAVTGAPLAVVAYDRGISNILHIPLIRLKASPLEAALGTQLIFRSVAATITEQRQLIRLTESRCSQPVIQSLQENSFEKNGDTWTKFNLTGIHSWENVAEQLSNLKLRFPSDQESLERLISRLDKAVKSQDVAGLLNIERALWPLKLSSVNIPTFVVPIRSNWAMDLFDYELGNQTLFGSDPSLIFKMENVYYRSARTKVPTAPARVLWYVSKSKGVPSYGVMAIRACSYVDEVVIGTPRELFKRFSKLGVYKWRDVFNAAQNDINKTILAFRFSRTELFEEPVALEDLKSLLNRNSAPIAPFQISDDAFLQIYQRGRKL